MPSSKVVDRDFKRGKFQSITSTQAFTDVYSNLFPIEAIQSYITPEILNISQNRLNRIRRNQKFYMGSQFENSIFDGEDKVIINYIKKFVDKSVDFLFGKGWSVEIPWADEEPELAKQVKDELTRVWQENDVDNLSTEMGQMGGISGDAFPQVTYVDVIKDGETVIKLDEYDERRGVKINLINSVYTHPIFDPFNKKRIKVFIIQFPFRDMAINQNGEVSESMDHVYTQVVTEKVIIEYLGKEELSRMDNALGEANIVHIVNQIIAGANFGFADIDGMIEAQEHLNTKLTDISDIIDYHASPLTVIYGTKASELQKGANRVWSGLPKDARVENLELKGNLEASQAYLAKWKTFFHEIVGIPEFSLGKELQISNTSAVTLHTLYMPLIELTNEKRKTYGAGIRRINKLILKYLEIKEGLKLPRRRDKYETRIIFRDPLPKDRLIELNMIGMEMQNKLESTVGALRRLGYDDPEKKLKEIAAFPPPEPPQVAGGPGGKPGGKKKGTGDIAQTPESEQKAETKAEATAGEAE